MALPPPFPSEEVVAAITPSELAEYLIRYLANDSEANRRYNQRNVISNFREWSSRSTAQHIAEAWAWAEAQGLLVFSVEAMEGSVKTLSRLADGLIKHGDFAAHRQASSMPKNLLHPAIAKAAWSHYVAGKYDVAVYQAFKQVEIAVALRSGLSGQGRQLMRAAFNTKNGPLADHTLETGEQNSIAELFSGAFGAFRNPVGHRDVTFSDPSEPAEQMIVASSLMRIVETIFKNT